MQLKYNSKSPAMITSTPRSHPGMRSYPRSLQRSQAALPRSQALTERERRLTFKLTGLGSETPRFGIRRCNTMLERPEQVYKPRKWYSESVTVEYIRQLRNWNKETEAKLKETMHVLKMQRSKSDLDVRPPEAQSVGGPLFGAGLIRERSQIILGDIHEPLRRESLGQSNKQEVKISKAVVPRKGLIELSTDQHAGFGVTGVGEKNPPVHDTPPIGGKTTSLIKRKDILDQIRQGNKLLEEYEEQKQKEEELTKSLGEYTMLDLQSRILEMTDAKSLRRKTSGDLEPFLTPTKPLPSVMKEKKGVVLPAIHSLNPFGS